MTALEIVACHDKTSERTARAVCSSSSLAFRRAARPADTQERTWA